MSILLIALFIITVSAAVSFQQKLEEFNKKLKEANRVIDRLAEDNLKSKVAIIEEHSSVVWNEEDSLQQRFFKGEYFVTIDCYDEEDVYSVEDKWNNTNRLFYKIGLKLEKKETKKNK